MAFFKVNDGVLEDCLLEDSEETEIEIPAGVKVVSDGAFASAKTVESITLGEDVEELDLESLGGLDALRELVFKRPLVKLSVVHSTVGFTGHLLVVFPFELLEFYYEMSKESKREEVLPEILNTFLAYFHSSGITFRVGSVNLDCVQMETLMIVNSLLGLLDKKPMTLDKVKLFRLVEERDALLLRQSLEKGVRESGESFAENAEMYLKYFFERPQKYRDSRRDKDFVTITLENCQNYGFDFNKQAFTFPLPSKVRFDLESMSQFIQFHHLLSPRSGSTLREVEFFGKSKVIDFSFLDGFHDLERLVLPPTKTVVLPCNCNGLREVVIPESVVSVSGGHRLCSLEEIVFPESVQEIEAFSFQFCRNLKRIVLPKSLQLLDVFAFFGDISLESVEVLGENVLLKGNAFRECNGLKEIVLPLGTKLEGNEVFQSIKLEKVTVGNTIADRSVIRFFNGLMKKSDPDDFMEALKEFIGYPQLVVSEEEKGKEKTDDSRGMSSTTLF